MTIHLLECLKNTLRVPSADTTVEQLKLSYIANRVCKNGEDTVKSSLEMSYNVKIDLSYYSEWPLSEKMKTDTHTKTCVWMYIESLFTTAKKLEIIQMSFNCVSKLRYIHIMEYYSTEKRNRLLRDTQRMNLKCTMLRKRT